MLYRRFGRTNLQMPVFSCGGMRYQFKWQDIPLQEIPGDSQRNLVNIIHRAVDLGINHIETARFYGTSEMQLGQVLPNMDREKLIVQTKVPPCSDPQEFRQIFEKSLTYLQLDYVDLLGLHGINNQELLDYSIGGCLQVAKELQAQGKARFIGFSTHAPLEVILQAVNTNEFDYINLHWYYINQWNWPAIEAANKLDMGVFIISPANKGGMLYQPSPKLVELCQPLSPIVFNDLFCLSHPQVHTLSIGAAQPGDFDEHLKTLELLDTADEILPPIIAKLEKAAIDTLGEDWIKTWDTNLPVWENTPGNINIKLILWLLNLALSYDMIEYGKMRYNLLGNADHWFPGNRADKLEELDLQECLGNSPHSEKIPLMLSKAHTIFKGEEVKRLSQS
ncbi:aldo/keto reductase [Cylindrospermopsis raciborskii]|uniref:Aldo/keto reductase n=1 Tax=Cylindrospermopsis raciborskii CENA302 TaxID=1170768 RepID=A0A9Q5QYB8_9CYAN|nr:aldo/keto reductase [Cylindrospermopsis raciborskii]NLQ06579.1 aldo/keto reductase [Cylindrospermopsis raciborskii MVCC19]OHY34338.1 aldo/keto reductase [Cylindrospermopsis raciborskii MVCC14]OPH10823.1 aldo/keto reductase [Cylindrospermopsis raciborskii CENA302]